MKFTWNGFNGLIVSVIPPARPVLLIEDGHASHISIELIELARANDIYLLCLPAHTTHILQPLDTGVFKSFKTCFSKACHRYIAKNPGRVITSSVIASLIGEVWPQSLTPLNIIIDPIRKGIGSMILWVDLESVVYIH